MNCNTYDKVKESLLKRTFKLDKITFYPDLLERGREIILTKSNERDIKYIMRRHQEHAYKKYGLPMSSTLFNLHDAKAPINRGYKVLHLNRENFLELQNLIDNYTENNKKARDYKPSEKFERDLEYFRYDTLLFEQEERELRLFKEQVDRDLELPEDNYSVNIVPNSVNITEFDSAEIDFFKNSYVEYFNYKTALLTQAKKDAYDIHVEIKKTLDPNKKAELIQIEQELKEAIYGNEIKGIVGLQSEIGDVKEYKEDYNKLLKDRDKIENSLQAAKDAGLDTTVLESQLMENAIDIYDMKQNDFTSIIRAHAEQDLNRAENLVKSGSLPDLVKAKQIINFYKSVNPANQDVTNPFYSKEELDRGYVHPNILKDLQNLYFKSANLENKVRKQSRKSVLNYINSLDKFVNYNEGKKLTEDQVFKDKEGLLDISLIDKVVFNIQDNPASGVQSVLQNAIFTALEDSIYKEQGNVKEISDGFDKENPKVVKELLRLGHKLSDNKELTNIKYKILGKLENLPDFSIFKQISKEGIYRNKLVQRESDKYRSLIKDAESRLNLDISSTNSKKSPEVIYHNYHNKLRAHSEIIKPHLLQDIALDPKYSNLLDTNTTTTLDDNYKNSLIDKLGQKGYNEIIENQKLALDNYLIAKEQMEKTLIFAYAMENGIEDPENLLLIDLDIPRQEELQNWTVNHSPFYNGLLFEENKKVKLGDRRYNSYALKYSTFIPRKKLGKVSYTKAYNDNIPVNFRNIKITETNQDTDYYDERFKYIEDNDILHDFWKTAMKASDYYQRSLTSEERQDWEPGDMPIDDSIALEKFIETSDSVKDKILLFLSKNFRDLLKRIGTSVSSTVDVPTTTYDYTDLTKVDVNTAHLNKGSRTIRNYIKLKEIELKAHLGSKKPLKDNLFLESIPNEFLREALFLYGINSSRLTEMSAGEIKNEYIQVFGLTGKRIVDANGVATTRYSTNILQVLQDLHTQNALKQTNGDLGHTLLKSATLASGIIARNNNLDMIQFMVDGYESIKKAKSNSYGTQFINRLTNRKVIDSFVRENAVSQMTSFIENVLTLRGSGTDNHLLQSRDDAENLKSNFFHKYVLNEGKDLDLIDVLLQSPDISEEDKIQLVRIKTQKIRYFDGVKGILRPTSTLFRLKSLGFRTLGNLVNLSEGTKQILIHDAIGEDWEPGKAIEALGVMKGAFIRNATQFLDKGLGDKTLTPQATKARFIIDRLDFIEDASTLEAKALKKNTTRGVLTDVAQGLNPYILIKKIEYVNQGSVALAMLMSEKVKHNTTGEEISVWDALDSKGKLHPDYRNEETINTWEKFNSQKARDFKARLNSARNKTSGDYTQIGESSLNTSIPGKLILNFKKWMPKYLAQMYGAYRYDFNSGKYTKGRIKSLHPSELALHRLLAAVTLRSYGLGTLFAGPMIILDIISHYKSTDPNKPKFRDSATRLGLMFKVAMKTVVGLPINFAATGVFNNKPIINTSNDKVFGKSLEENLKKRGIKPEDIGNIRAMGVELGMNMILMGLALLVYGTLLSGDDDDEEFIGYTKNEWGNITHNTIYPLLEQGEIFYSDPLKALESLVVVPMFKFFKDLDKIATSLDKMIQGLDTNYIARGRDARKYKTDKIASKVLPVPMRDVESKKYMRFTEYNLGLQMFMKDKYVEKQIGNIRSEIKNNIYQTITSDNIEQRYKEYNIEFKPRNREDELYTFDQLREKLLNKVMKRDYPKPNKGDFTNQELLDDLKEVRSGKMTIDQYKSKYYKEEVKINLY